MVAVGLVLLTLGVLAIVAAVFVNDGTGGEILGIDMSVTTIFLFGVSAGAAVILGYSIMKWGTKRGLAQRKERKELSKISKRLDERDQAETKTESKTDSKPKPAEEPPSTAPPETPPA